MKFIAIFDKDEQNYKSNRLCYLENAKDVHIKQSINGEYSLEFKLPKGDKKQHFIVPERKAGYDGKIFRIKDIKGQSVTAITLMQDCCRTHIQYIGDMIGKSAYKIFENIFKSTPYITVLSEEEIRRLGMEPVTDRIDFFELSKKTPIGCMNVLMERLNKYRVHSEIYIDNDKIGLVRQLGKDRGVVVDPKYNANNIEPEISTYNLITKLYPYGRDDMPLNGTQYILSPNYDILGEYEGFCNFDEITDQDELKSAAMYQFDESNVDRIDVPNYSVPFRFIDANANEKIQLGDTITINDRERGITSKQRVTNVDIYPYEPGRSTFTAGKPDITVQEALTTMFTASQYLRLSKNRSEELKTSTVEFMESNESVYLDSENGTEKIAKYKTGALFVSPNERYAVAIMDGKIKIGTSDKSKKDGWNWVGVFGHGKGDLSEIFTGYLYTNFVTLLSQNGTLKIGGEDTSNQIQMFDTAGTLRFNAGYSISLNRYIFELYDLDGNKTLYMDDNGEAVFSGSIDTKKDVKVGQKIIIRDINGNEGFTITAQGAPVSESVTITANNSRSISIETNGNISIEGSNINITGNFKVNGKEIASNEQIADLRNQINRILESL